MDDKKYGELIKQTAQFFVEEDKKAKENERKMQDLWDEHGVSLHDPFEFDRIVNSEHKEFAVSFLDTLLYNEEVYNEVTYSNGTKQRIRIAYQHIRMIQRHIEQMLLKYNDTESLISKVQFIVNQYMDYVRSNTIPNWKPGDAAQVPEYGSSGNWIAFVDSVPGLAYGESESFINAKRNLEKEIEYSAMS